MSFSKVYRVLSPGSPRDVHRCVDLARCWWQLDVHVGRWQASGVVNHSRMTFLQRLRLSRDLIGLYRSTYRIVYMVLQPLLVIT